MSKFIHISAVNPDIGRGGVEQFARDLRTATGEMLFLSYHNPTLPPWETARTKNEENLAQGMIEPDDIVVADGFYGYGLHDGQVERLITVCHGSYAGMMREYMINPPPSFGPGLMAWLLEASRYQEATYRNSEVVCVSKGAEIELQEIYGPGLDVHTIRNGVDLALYTPGEGSGWVCVAGNDERKGSDIIRHLRDNDQEISELGYDDEKPSLWRKYKYAILPSRYEGGQYAALEAMATNMQIVAYHSGFFNPLDVGEEYYVGTYDFFPRTFERLMVEMLDHEPMRPREWVQQHASIEQFRRDWRLFLGLEE